MGIDTLGSGRRPAATALLAAAALAAIAAGCGGSAAAPGRAATAPAASPGARGAPQVHLALAGGGAPVRLRSCGFDERYRTYRFGGYVHYAGRVSPAPAGSWSVKVKLKRCIPHGYSETFFEIVPGRSDGSFAGVVPTLNPNTFYVRADFKYAGGTARSPLAFFRTVGHG